MRLRIKNWKTFQHYDHRCPPWIKLHFKILSSRDWVSASDSERVLAIACMLVASQDEAKDGSFDADPEYIQRVAYLHETPDFTQLIKREFLETLADASESKQLLEKVCTETEKSREETEGERALLEIAQAYPFSTYTSEFDIPRASQDSIFNCIQRERGDWRSVLEYTRRYAKSVTNPNVVMGMTKFYDDPQNYRRQWQSNAAPPVGKFTQLLSAVSEPYSEPGEQFGTTRDRQG